MVEKLVVVGSDQFVDDGLQLVNPWCEVLILDQMPFGVLYGWLEKMTPRLLLKYVWVHESAYDNTDFDVYWDIIESFCGV